MGRGKSTYRLYVKFKPEYRRPHMHFNYYSDDRPNAEKGLANLLKRVLHGTCRNRYEIAMLYEEETNRCLEVYLSGRLPMGYVEYLSGKTEGL